MLKYSIKTNILIIFLMLMSLISILILSSQYYFSKQLAVNSTQKTFKHLVKNCRGHFLSFISFPLSITITLRLLFKANSYAAKSPAGPAPIMATSYEAFCMKLFNNFFYCLIYLFCFPCSCANKFS